MRIGQAVLIVLSALALAGCPKRPQTLPDAGGPLVAQDGAQDGAQTGRSMDAQVGTLTAEQQAMEVGSIIYFDYDRAEIRAEFVPIITAHARFLNASSERSVRLEGHSDERGSREYNIGLGERRAQVVRRALMLQGVADAQITTISYGEERPAVLGSDESAYAKNRRVEFVYRQ